MTHHAAIRSGHLMKWADEINLLVKRTRKFNKNISVPPTGYIDTPTGYDSKPVCDHF
jgi:hypothetical protein